MTNQWPDRSNQTDENQWLEEIYGEKPLAWVKEQNARTMETFDADALKNMRTRILEVYDSDDRIPMLSKHGEWYYNFWQDAANPKGLWRRTTLESYEAANPQWDIVLDIDALSVREGKDWVWGGAELCYPAYQRALLRLSPDGGDAVEIREFDVELKAFVEDGFTLPRAKSRTAWIDIDTIFVATDFGGDSLSVSGYPRELRRWRRHAQLDTAETVYTAEKNHMAVEIDHDPAENRSVVTDIEDFFHYRYFVLQDGKLGIIQIPLDAEISTHGEWLTIQPKSDWTVNDTTYATGTLLAAKLVPYLEGNRALTVVFEPDGRTFLQSISWTRNHLIVNLMRDVASEVRVYTPGENEWEAQSIQTPPLQQTTAYGVDPDHSDEYWQLSTGYLDPTTLSLGKVGSGVRAIRSMPPLFDDTGLTVVQHFATSEDGTRIPYFMVGKLDDAAPGPTLLSGYGGFEASRTPAYDASIGRAWLEDGGTYVVANIRGGGEYGPAWHTSALRENRPRAYQDFAAVAQDLIDRGVTTPEHLGCMGGSNGGLLVGNMLTHYPELFGAIVCTVPLLDMKRYVHLNAGASWIAEYGDPEKPEEWEFIQTFSPYHNLREGVDYPAILFYTATSDDRVGPVQARKMAARMIDRGIPDVWFYENTQGGHGGAADNSERAFMRAMCLQFLQRELT